MPGVAPPRDGLTFIEAARRAQIVECAIATIAEIGYARASLAEIAKRAGISKSVISYHFAGKDDLIHELVTGILQGGLAAMQSAIDAQPTPRGKLEAYICSNLEYMRSHQQAMAALVQVFTANRGGGDTPLISDDLALAGVRVLSEIIEAGQASGDFRQCSAQVVAVSIRASIDAIPSWLAATPEPNLDAYADEMIALFERALLTEAPQNR
jgi:AcrR family transcriptional regulator